jgi:hypothetical protein
MPADGGYAGRHVLPSADSTYLSLKVDGDTMPRLEITPSGVFTGNGSEDLTSQSASDLGAISVLDATGATNIPLAARPTLDIELLADATFTFTDVAPLVKYQLYIYQDSAGGHTVTWPTVSWVGGLAPFINTAPSSLTVVEISSIDGGATYVGIGAQVDGNSPLNYNILEAFPYEQALIGGTSTSGVVRYTYFTAPTSGTYDSIMTAVGTTAAATITRNEAGLYEVTNAATGALGDLIATTGHVAAMWATISIAYDTPLTTSVELVAGQRYAMAFLCVATTQPLMLCRATNSNITAGWANLHSIMSPKRVAICSAQTELVADGSGLTLGMSQSAPVWGALKAS